LGINRLITAIIYFATGVFFTFIAINSIEQTVWEVNPVIFLIVATIGFGAFLRAMGNIIK